MSHCRTAIFLFALTACGESRTERTTASAPSAPALDSTTFPTRTVIELSALREGTTPAEWLRNHPGDSLAPFRVDERVNQDSKGWCVRAEKRDSLADGHVITRYAYFYPPQVPASLELPSEANAALVRNECTLGAVWVESAQSDSVAGFALANRTYEELTRAFGQIVPGPDSVPDSAKARRQTLMGYATHLLGISFFGSAYWRAPGRWQHGSTTIVSAFDLDAIQGRHPRTLAFAYLPVSRFGNRDEDEDVSDPTQTEGDSVLVRAAKLTHFDSAKVGEFLALRETPAENRVRPISNWLAAASGGTPEQRAAALFIADAVVPASTHPDDSTTRKAFDQVGVQYENSELGGGWVYKHSLLEESLRLDPNGPVGELATFAMLDLGFDLNQMCSGGFEEVIKAGEPFLGRLKSPDARAHAMFVLGDAYSDIVALGAGEGGDYADTSTFTPRAAGARQKAIAYYRQALSLNPKSNRARAAWLNAWRLLAGLPPTATHFFCVYD